jgi:DNA-binding XRE family transcriptional regulator
MGGTPDAGTQRKMGRPTKLTPATRAVIVAALATGANLRQAAETAGVHRVTMYRWEREAARQGASPATLAIAADLAEARAEMLRKSVVREPITDGEGREIGTRITRHLRNGITEVTEELARPARRALRTGTGKAAALEHGPLGELLGLAEVA